MYQGTNPTALKSQQQILETMRNLLKKKEYAEISISEICEQSNTSRQTFYKLFGTKENLLLFVLENAPYANQDVGDEPIPLALFCELYAQYVIANYDLMKMLVENNLMEVLYRLMYKGISSCRQSLSELAENEREYAVAFICSGLCAVTQKYLTEHHAPEQKALAELASKVMSVEW